MNTLREWHDARYRRRFFGAFIANSLWGPDLDSLGSLLVWLVSSRAHVGSRRPPVRALNMRMDCPESMRTQPEMARRSTFQILRATTQEAGRNQRDAESGLEQSRGKPRRERYAGQRGCEFDEQQT
jgi:hypothetical protein